MSIKLRESTAITPGDRSTQGLIYPYIHTYMHSNGMDEGLNTSRDREREKE